jgi:hypothetical protein
MGFLRKKPVATQRFKASITLRGKVYYHCPQPQCNVAIHSKSMIKKHLEEHFPPYRCTFLCPASFSNLNDWKTHEYTTHQQQQLWLCLERRTNRIDRIPNETADVCHETFATARLYSQHLIHEHGISDHSLIEKKQHKHEIGKASQGQFWCGWCKIVNLEGKAGPDERVEHFAKHEIDRYDWSSYQNLDGTFRHSDAMLEMKFGVGGGSSTPVQGGLLAKMTGTEDPSERRYGHGRTTETGWSRVGPALRRCWTSRGRGGSRAWPFADQWSRRQPPTAGDGPIGKELAGHGRSQRDGCHGTAWCWRTHKGERPPKAGTDDGDDGELPMSPRLRLDQPSL